MSYMGDKKHWDDKFKSRGDKCMSPDGELVENIHHLKTGSVLDVACGDGRNTMYLLEKGFDVTGIDFSSEALGRLEHFASDYQLTTKVVDLEKVDDLDGLGAFDNVIINHYRAKEAVLLRICGMLNNDGILYISGFGEKHKTDERVRDVDIIRSSDVDCLMDTMELLHKKEFCDKRGCFVTYILRIK